MYADGNICMDTLQDKWSPCHNVNSVLMSIQSMLTDPNCSSPANPEAAQLFIKDKAAYNRWVWVGGRGPLVCLHLAQRTGCAARGSWTSPGLFWQQACVSCRCCSTPLALLLLCVLWLCRRVRRVAAKSVESC